MFATLTDNGRYMVGMTYWRKGGEEPPRRADETGGEGVARRIDEWPRSQEVKLADERSASADSTKKNAP